MPNDGGDAIATEPIAVTDYMVAPVHTIHESERLSAAHGRMTDLGISALPVVDDTGQLGAVITAVELLRIGRMRGEGRERWLDLPDQRLREHMSGPMELVARTASLAEAARRMVRRQVHHVYVARDRIVEGVVATRDLVRAVSDLRIERPVGELVAGAVVTLASSDPLGLAIDRVLAGQHRALVVLDAGWPVGIFDAREALGAKDASARSPVEVWMTASFVCVPHEMPAHRAAARAAATGPRAVVVTRGAEVVGVLTGLDFAALLA